MSNVDIVGNSFREFELSLDRFAEETVPEAVQRTRNKMAAELLTGVVQLTPVDVAVARANWHAGDAAANTRYDPNARDPSGEQTIAAGRAAIEAVVDPFAPVAITGDAFYLRFLNHGTVKRPALHMVGRTVERVLRIFGG